MIPDGFSLHCGAYGVQLYEQLKVCESSLGCSTVGANELFDLGFRLGKLEKHGLQLMYNGVVIASWEPT